MSLKQHLFIINFLLISSFSFSQDVSFQEVDSVTYTLYQKERWQQLAAYGKQLAPQKIDYYYYNVRLGIAHYNLGGYYNAISYFKNAINNNTTDFAISYVYYSYINLGQIERAKEIYNQLTEESQRNIKNENRALASVFVESGLKSSNTTFQDDLTYYSFTGLHRFSDKTAIVTNISFINQDSGWETNNQYQLGFFPSYYLSKGRSISLGYVYANNTNKRSAITTGEEFKTNTIITNNAIIANYSKQFHRFRAEGFVQYIHQVKKTTGEVEISESLNNTIFGATVSYALPSVRDRFSFGVNLVYAFGNSNSFMASPFITVRISPKLFFRTVYYTIDHFLYLDKDSNILFVNADTNTQRIAGTFNYILNAKWQVVGTYSNENITNIDPLLNHKLNSFFVGINYHF